MQAGLQTARAATPPQRHCRGVDMIRSGSLRERARASAVEDGFAVVLARGTDDNAPTSRQRARVHRKRS